LGLLENI